MMCWLPQLEFSLFCNSVQAVHRRNRGDLIFYSLYLCPQQTNPISNDLPKSFEIQSREDLKHFSYNTVVLIFNVNRS